MSDSRLQEIMTRAVVGRAERTLTWCHKLPSNQMTQVLGVRVGRIGLSVKTEERQPVAELVVDCDLWCSDGERTKVLRTRCRCVQEVPITLRGEVLGDEEFHLELVGGPRSTGVRVEEEAIYVDFEAMVQVEATALARLWVKAYEFEIPLALVDEAADYDSSASPYGSH